MNSSSPLESIYFVKLPDGLMLSLNTVKVDSDIPVPIQKKAGEAKADLQSL